MHKVRTPIPWLLLATFAAAAFAYAEQTLDSDLAAIESAKRAIATGLRDPDSAQFRNVFVQRNLVDAVEQVNVCGEVNAKNAYGGYVGFKPFYFSMNTMWGEVYSGGADGETFKMIFDVVCSP